MLRAVDSVTAAEHEGRAAYRRRRCPPAYAPASPYPGGSPEAYAFADGWEAEALGVPAGLTLRA